MYSDFKVRTPVHNRAIGIEIEGFVNDVDSPLINYGAYTGFFSMQRDGSIDTDNWSQRSVEFVSQPLSVEWMKKEIYKLYKKYPTFASNRSCGIHVHVSRKWLSEKKAKTVYHFLQSLSGEQFETLFGRMPNMYCETSAVWGRTRYAAINNENISSIEFRMFKSGNAEWACYCVDMVKYLIDNAYRLNIDAIMAFRDIYKV